MEFRKDNSVDYGVSNDYNYAIEFLKNCIRKVQFAFCPLLTPCLEQLSKYSEKYLQKRARKVA